MTEPDVCLLSAKKDGCYFITLKTVIVMRHSILLFILVFSLASCRNSADMGLVSDGDDLQRVVKVEETFEVRKLSEIFSHIEYLPLETTEGSELGHISKAFYDNGRLYLLDISANAVLCFRSDGSFVARYSSVGRGPEEYRNLSDMDLLPGGKGVIVLADWHNLFLLDRDLNVIETTRAPINAVGVSSISEDVLGYHTGGRQDMLGDGTDNLYNMVLHSRATGAVEGLFPDMLSKRIGFSGTNRFVRSDVLVYLNPMDYSCYFLSQGGIDSVWIFDFGSRGVDGDETAEITTREDYNSFLASRPGVVTEVETVSFRGDVMYLSYLVREGPRDSSQMRKEYYVDLRTGLFYPLIPDANDLSPIGFPPLFLGVHDDGFIGHFPSFVLSHESIKELPESISDTDIFDNPVIVFYHVKK